MLQGRSSSDRDHRLPRQRHLVLRGKFRGILSGLRSVISRTTGRGRAMFSLPLPYPSRRPGASSRSFAGWCRAPLQKKPRKSFYGNAGLPFELGLFWWFTDNQVGLVDGGHQTPLSDRNQAFFRVIRALAQLPSENGGFSGAEKLRESGRILRITSVFCRNCGDFRVFRGSQKELGCLCGGLATDATLKW